MKARLVGKKEIAERTGGFSFEIEGRTLAFKPGQSIDVKLLDPKYQDEKGTSRTFSIASSPAESELMVATRLTGSAFKKSLLEAPLNTEVDIKGPFGAFTLDKDESRASVLIAGGIGITPFHGIIKDPTERDLARRIILVYSNRNAKGAVFMDDFDRWVNTNKNFLMIARLTQPDPADRWNHGTGRVDAELFKKYVEDARTGLCYVAGPPGFVKSIRKALTDSGTDPENIRTEEFSGY